ncbi:MAG: FG-GAP-like repeat-containing protein [Cyclobacteriaceae bacterium]
MKKYTFILTILTLTTGSLFAQVPVITSLDKTHATVFEVVTITGSSFGTDTSNIEVFFGGVAADSIVCISNDQCMLDTEIRVLVPPGATTSSVSVLRHDTKYTAYSPEVFTISYDGNDFDNAFLDGPYLYETSDDNLYNLCLCDFNRDGLNDIATSDTDNEEVTILQNTTSGIDTVAFTPVEIDLGAKTRWVRCGDLNGDGLPELVFSASNNNTDKERIYIYQNTSTTIGGVISFDEENPVSLSVQGNLAARMVIRDIDGDGKPDITAADISSEGGVSVFLNTSTGSSISFSPTPSLPFAVFGLSPVELSGIAVEDFSGDGLPDIAVSEDENSGIYIITNMSTPGSLGFGALTELTATGRTTNLKAGDLDNDGLIDLVLINDTYVGALRNTSEFGVVSFASPVRFDQSSLGREGLELTDLDGNGLLDIAVAAQNRNWIVLLFNKSTVGSLDFNTKKIILANENTNSVRAGDLNGDGKPDLAYTETASDKIAIQLNRNCIKPVLEPQGGLGVCDQLPYQLSVTKAIGVEYVWESSSDGSTFAPVAEAADSTYTFTTSNELYYRVKVSSSHNDFTCSPIASNIVQVVRPEGFVPSKPTIINKNPEEPICFGETISLKAESVNADYYWTGPNGFTSDSPNPTIPNATKENEGTYVLYVKASEANGGCVSDTATTFVKVSEPGAITIQPVTLPVFFEGGQTKLKVNQVDGQTYQWQRGNQEISEATDLAFTTNKQGEYIVVTRNAEGCLRRSDPITVAYARPDILQELCLNETGTFTISPASLNGQEVKYRWNFGENSNFYQGDTVKYQFSKSGSQTVTIEILEKDGSVRDRYQQSIKVLDIPALNIQADGNPNLCPETSVTLEASEGFASYSWNTGATERILTVNQSGTYTVTATTKDGCTTIQSVDVADADNPEAQITASSERIALGDTLRLQAEGGVAYRWNADESLSDTTIANPFVRPLITTNYTCTVTNEQGCESIVAFTVTVDRSLDVIPERAFTPNSDGNNDTWYIDKMDLYPDCQLTLFNRQGTKIFEEGDYTNLQPWDGSTNNTPVPAGVYFYLIDCGKEAGRQTGSVTIIR